MKDRRTQALALAVLFSTLGSAPLGAQSAFGRALAFRGTIGSEQVENSLGAVLDGGYRTEWSVIFRAPAVGPLRLRGGAGLSRVTYELSPGYAGAADTNGHARRWNHVRWHFLAGAELVNALPPGVDLYFEVRAVKGRLRAQTELDWPVIADPPTQRPYRTMGSQGREYVFGFKTDLGFLPFQLDVLYRDAEIHPRPTTMFDMSSWQLGVHGEANARGLQIGIFWWP